MVTDRLRQAGWSYNAIAGALGRVSGPSVAARVKKRQARADEVARRATPKTRTCMTCSAPFPSPHAGVRMCDGCRYAAADSSPFEPPAGPGLLDGLRSDVRSVAAKRIAGFDIGDAQ